MNSGKSIFAQLMDFLPTKAFGRCVRRYQAVVCVIPKGPGEDPVLIPIKIVRAQAERGSVLMPTFIEDDRTEVITRTNLLYWIETGGPPTNAGDPVQLFAKVSNLPWARAEN